MLRFFTAAALAAVFGIFSPALRAQLTWSVQPYNINSVFFSQTNTAVGWACGDFGTLLGTTDGGDNWSVQKAATTADFLCIAFADDKNGAAAGRQGVIFGTSDGGKTWKQRTSPTIRDIASMRFAPGQALRGYAVGRTGTVLATTDAGLSWFPQTSPVTIDLTDISPVSATVALAVGRGGAIIRTNDGGTVWQLVNSGTAHNLGGAYLLNAQTGWTAGDSGYVAKTTDGGTTWTPQPTGVADHLASIQFSGPSLGWAVGAGGMILRTTTGGATWATVNDSNRALGLDVSDLTRVFAGGSTSTNKAWVCGKGGLLIATRDGGFNWIRQAEKPRGTLNAVYFAANRINGWAAGTFGNIYVTSSGGRIWQKQPIPTPVNFNAIQLGPDRRGCAVGDVGTALYTTNGASWQTGSTPVTDHLRGMALSQTNPSNGWAVGSGGTILVTSNGGSVWAKGSNPRNVALNAVHFAETSLGCAVGALGEVLTSFNGGATWTPQFSGVNQELKGVHLTSWTTGWAVGDNSIMLKTTNSCVNWTNHTFLAPPRSLNVVRFTDALNGWIAGAGGTLLSTSDAGATWKQHNGVVSDNINALWFPNARSGWFAGANGLILHVEDDSDYLLFPANGESDVDTRALFRWKKHAGSNGYKVMYSTAPDAFADGGAVAATTILTNNESDTAAVAAPFLQPQITYSWTVEERATGFRLGVRTFRTSVGPVRLKAAAATVTVCSGRDTLLQVIPTAGKTPLTYTWRQSSGAAIPPDEIIAETGATLRIKPQESRRITCIVTDAFGHSDSAQISVNVVLLQPVVSYSPEYLCEGAAVRLSVAGKYARYSWLRNQIPVGSDSVFSAVSEGKYSVVVQDANGCEGIAGEIALEMQAKPSPSVEGSDVVCVNQKNVPYRAGIFSIGRSYQWAIAGGAERASITSGENLSTVTLSFGARGEVLLRLREIFNATKCFADTIFRITVTESGFKPVIASKSGGFVLCRGAKDTLEAPPGFAKYQWRLDNQDISGATTYQLSIADGGNYSVYVEDVGGCKGSSDPVQVKRGGDPRPEIDGETSACLGAKNAVYTIRNPQTGSAYVWSVTGGATIQGASQGVSIRVNFGAKGAAEIRVTESDPAGCAGNTVVAVAIGDSLQPKLAGATTFCAGQSATLDAGPGDSYKWFGNGAEIAAQTGRTLTVKSAGTYYAVVTQSGCSGTSDAVTVQGIPRPDSTISEDARTGLLTAASASSWQWYSGAPPDTVRIAGKTARSFQPDSAGIYSVAAVSAGGCTTTATFRAGGTVNLGEFAVRELSTGDSAITLTVSDAIPAALLEILAVAADTAKVTALGVEQFRLRISWSAGLLQGAFPATPPDSAGELRWWEFVAPAAEFSAFTQRLTFYPASATDTQAVVSLTAIPEDASGASPRGRTAARRAVINIRHEGVKPPGTGELTIVQIMPNPADGRTTVVLRGAAGVKAEILITDNNGKQLTAPQQTVIPASGEAKVELSTANLAIGQYFVTARHGSRSTSEPMQVVR